jgi:hypothetical protein
VIQEEGLYAYNMHNILEKHFSISIAPVRNRAGLLVMNIAAMYVIVISKRNRVTNLPFQLHREIVSIKIKLILCI